MKFLKGWKTITFNVAILITLTWNETRDGLVSVLGGWEYTTAFLAMINLALRVATIGPIALMWITKEEQDGVDTGKTK